MYVYIMSVRRRRRRREPITSLQMNELKPPPPPHTCVRILMYIWIVYARCCASLPAVWTGGRGGALHTADQFSMKFKPRTPSPPPPPPPPSSLSSSTTTSQSPRLLPPTLYLVFTRCEYTVKAFSSAPTKMLLHFPLTVDCLGSYITYCTATVCHCYCGGGSARFAAARKQRRCIYPIPSHLSSRL